MLLNINKGLAYTLKHRLALKPRRLCWYRQFSVIACFISLISPSIACALLQAEQATLTSAYECTQVTIEDVDSALLTKQERIALLDDSLTESIDSYSSCVSSAAQNMAGGGSGQGGGKDLSAGNGSQNANSGKMQDESEKETVDQNAQAEEQTELSQETPAPEQNTSRGKGSTPAPRGIIPPKDNDKIICKLLFQEIKKTQDPDMLKGLKQQYTNYKCG